MDKAVAKYIDSIENVVRKSDMLQLTELLESSTGETAQMWGSSIISFGLYQYKYPSGREGEAPKFGLSNRKQALVLYGLHISDATHPNSQLLQTLGKHKTGKGCVYISSVNDIDLTVLKTMVEQSRQA